MPIEELSTVARAIKLLEDGANRLKKNPFELEDVMNEIDNFWGIETGRIEDEKECEICDRAVIDDEIHIQPDGTINCENCCHDPKCDRH